MMSKRVLISEESDAFTSAMQKVLQRHISDDQKACTIWLEICDLPEYGALLDKSPSPSSSTSERLRALATLYGKPLADASDEEVARALAGAERSLAGMRSGDPDIEFQWRQTIACLRAEQAQRLSRANDGEDSAMICHYCSGKFGWNGVRPCGPNNELACFECATSPALIDDLGRYASRLFDSPPENFAEDMPQ